MFKVLTTPIPYSLVDNCNKGTQKYILAQIFTKNKNKCISKREIEKLYSLEWSLRDISPEKKYTKEEFINMAKEIPGDVQRNLRLFYEKFNKYGLKKIEKNKSENSKISYIWEPITMDKLEDIIYPEARNIFKTKSEKKHFLVIRNYTCEICGACKSDNETLRLAIDHWRAHSTYNIDSPKIAVLLCEKCNNIHHNYDASKIALNYKDNLKIVKNWLKKEKEIRSNGFLPNDDDIKTQKENKQIIVEYYKDLNPIDEDFWDGLF